MDDQLAQMTRRGVLGVAGAAGVAYLVGGVPRLSGGAVGTDVGEAVAATCVMTPAKTVGPYFVDEKLNRSDVREGQQGIPLALTMYVFDADNDCAPVAGATVDIWHCNARGLYSDESANGTSGQKWLRGYQTTDSAGKVTFTTIYPGWYSGRAIHIHFKVRVYNGSTETLEFTSQTFFTDEQNAQVLKQSPYNARGGSPDTTDSSDSIYGSDGSKLLLQPRSDGNGGYAADFSVGVSKSTSQLGNDSAGGGGPGGGPPGSTSTGTSVSASLSSLKAVRLATGARQVRATIRATERVTAAVRVTRSGRTLARASKALAAGTRTLKVNVPRHYGAGAATVSLTLTDASGNTRTVRRTVHLA